MVAGVDGAAGFDAGGGAAVLDGASAADNDDGAAVLDEAGAAGGDCVTTGVDGAGWTAVVSGSIARGRNGFAFLTVRAGARRAIALSPWIDI